MEVIKSGLVVFGLSVNGDHLLVEEVELSVQLAIGTLQNLQLAFQLVNI